MARMVRRRWGDISCCQPMRVTVPSFWSITSIALVSRASLVASFRSAFRRPHLFHIRPIMSAIAPTLDRNSFSTDVRLVALKIPAKACNDYLHTFNDALFRRPKMKKVYDAPDSPSERLVLLAEQYQDLSLQDLPEELVTFNKKYDGKAQEYILHLGYEHLGADEVLRRILPATVKEVPSAFEQAGHLAHLNLREEALPYKHLIAQVLLDKNPTIKTVVNKIGNIETEFRTFPMELLGGENNYVVTLKESHAKFTFNFAEVYWNSRLQMEHSRLIGIIQQAAGYQTTEYRHSQQSGGAKSNGSKDKKATATAAAAAAGVETVAAAAPAAPVSAKKAAGPPLVVADMMAGVGPFAVPLAMPLVGTTNSVTTAERMIIVHANDLNPASYKYLEVNARTNNCSAQRLRPYCMDGRHFILKLVAENVAFEHAIMNLPQNATDFLDVFIGLHTRLGEKRSAAWSVLPRIHVYAFSTLVEDPIGDIVRRSAGVLRCPADSIYPGAGAGKYAGPVPQCEGHIVRDVAPKKVMVCLSFTLPVEVARAAPLDFPVTTAVGGSESGKKRDSAAAGLSEPEETAV